VTITIISEFRENNDLKPDRNYGMLYSDSSEFDKKLGDIFGNLFEFLSDLGKFIIFLGYTFIKFLLKYVLFKNFF
jgi:hypothetical protein